MTRIAARNEPSQGTQAPGSVKYTAGATASAPTAAADAPRTGAPASLAAAVAQRVQALSPLDPFRDRKVLRIVLELSLQRRLGNEDLLAQDPDFHALVDAVQQRMLADPALAEAAQTLSSRYPGTGRPG